MATERIQGQINRLLESAGEALTQRDWASVKDRATDVLVLDPENQDALALQSAAKWVLGTQKSTPP